MKLRKAVQGQYVFQMAAREKPLLFEVLKYYPLIPSSYHQQRRAEGAIDEASHRLIEEALAEQREANKRLVHSLFENPARFRAHGAGWELTMSRPELELLLQVLNDIRVGSWISLGSPNPKEQRRAALTEQNAPYYWAMELCGQFEHILLEALTGEGA